MLEQDVLSGEFYLGWKGKEEEGGSFGNVNFVFFLYLSSLVLWFFKHS